MLIRGLSTSGSVLVLAVLLAGAGASAFGAEENGAGAGQHGQVGRPAAAYLGIDVRDVADEEVSVLKLKDARGAEIIKVDHDGPAGKMGLRERDVVVGMNGIAIEGEDQIRRMLRESAPGKTVVLIICRDGQQLTVTAQMADRSQVERQAWEQHLAMPASGVSMSGPQAPANALPTGDDSLGGGNTTSSAASHTASTKYSKSFLGTLLPTPTYTGAMLELVGPQLAQFFGVPAGSALLVRGIETNSPAAMAGLKAGDVVIRADSRHVASMGDWARAIHDAKGRPVPVVVLRDKQERTVTITPDAKKRSELELPPADSAPVMDLAHSTAF